MAGSYLFVNLAFVGAYFVSGPDAIVGIDAQGELERFIADFFSVQTFATIGYGGMSPARLAAHILVVLEAVFGLLLVALGAGISFARYARRRAKILFSERAVVAPYGDHTAFMFRIANARHTELIDLHVRVLLTQRNANGARDFVPLSLERHSVLFFTLSWTVVHPIEPSSPLWGKTADDLAANNAEFLILLSATDETFAQVVHARSSYEATEVEWRARFQSIYNPPGPDGRVSIDIDKLSAIQPA